MAVFLVQGFFLGVIAAGAVLCLWLSGWLAACGYVAFFALAAWLGNGLMSNQK